MFMFMDVIGHVLITSYHHCLTVAVWRPYHLHGGLCGTGQSLEAVGVLFSEIRGPWLG